ncbi:keywimysin-related RiPP [Streptomyces platensis]|uniref:keywimysin-related RiPP n=1 Tax=Streptomyces platensis TaxID=58346 RepID=UPI00386E3CF3|nr:keywimysin-related RiPP [Streptomyces platensis]
MVLLLRGTDGLQLASVARRTSCSGFPMNPGAAVHEPDGRLMAGLGRVAESASKETAMKKAYEAPTLVRLGSFRKKTGLLQSSGNDRLVLSKN